MSPLLSTAMASYSRDFTYVDNAVQANILSLFTTNNDAVNQIYNVACGERTSLNELWHYIKELTQTDVDAIHRENRVGDIPHSLADINKASQLLKYQPKVDVKLGLHKAFQWYLKGVNAL